MMSSETAFEKLPENTVAIKEISPSSASSPVLSPQVASHNVGGSPESKRLRGTGSVTFEQTIWQERDRANDAEIGNAIGPPATSSSPFSQIYWRSPASMVGCFFLGLLVSIGHHLYYNSLSGDLVGDVDEQQRKLRYGTAFAFITQISLVGSVGIAYTQWLWKTLRRRTPSLSCLDAAFSADTHLLSMFNPEMWWKIKLASLLALLAWCLQLPSLITPATLNVIPGIRTNVTDMNVSCLYISTNDTNQYSRFEYSAPLLQNTSRGVNDTSKLFVGPRTVLARLSTATATTGRILPISPPFPNSSYPLQFYGPAVKCQDANSTEAKIIDDILDLKKSIRFQNYTEITNAYFAFVPNDYIINGGKVIDSEVIETISELRMQRPVNASNQLWATYQRYVWNGTGDRNTEIHHTICRLYNASYNVHFQFEAGLQTITKRGLDILNKIDYPKDDPYTQSNFAEHSYSAFMWVLTDQLVGSMGWWVDNSTGQKYSEIATPIGHNSLLGSLDLDLFFNLNDGLYLKNETYSNRPMSDQRTEDKALAQNKTLDLLIEELSFNTTLSLMSSNLLSPNATASVSQTIHVNVYSYNLKNLWIAYGLAILSTIIANILGVLAYVDNGAAHDRTFSSILGATREAELNDLFSNEDHGVLPVPKRTKRVLLKFRDMDNGGWSFRRTAVSTERERRRRSLMRRRKSSI